MNVLEQLSKAGGLVVDSHRSDDQSTLGFTAAEEIAGFEFRRRLWSWFGIMAMLRGLAGPGHTHVLFLLLGSML